MKIQFSCKIGIVLHKIYFTVDEKHVEREGQIKFTWFLTEHSSFTKKS